MAALDPTAKPEPLEDGTVPTIPRSTLRIIKASGGEEDDEEYDDSLLGSEEDSDDEEEAGPSDPSKSKKARQDAMIKKLIAAAQKEEASDDEMEDADSSKKAKKGKGKAVEEESDEDEDSEGEDDEDVTVEDYVVCTLDTERVCVSPLVFFTFRHKLTRMIEFPTTPRHRHRRGRAGLLRRLWHPQRLPHRKLRSPPLPRRRVG